MLVVTKLKQKAERIVRKMKEKEATVQPGKTTEEKEAMKKTKPGVKITRPGVKITRVKTMPEGGTVAELTQGRSRMTLDSEELKRLGYAVRIYRSQEGAGIQGVEVRPDGEVILSGTPEFWAGRGVAPEPEPAPELELLAKPEPEPADKQKGSRMHWHSLDGDRKEISTPAELADSLAAEIETCESDPATKKKKT